jgi:hypothetical protein
MEKNQKLLSSIRSILSIETIKLKPNYYVFYWLIIFWVIEFLLIIIFWVKIYLWLNSLDKKSENLKNTIIYNIDYNANIWKDYKKNMKIDELFDQYNIINKQKNDLDKLFDKNQISYNSFTKNLYLPSLNIWKDFYTQNIDISLMWQKFLDYNPFIDTNLISKWSWFFKDVWWDLESNNITDINIWKIEYDQDWYFSIPVNIQFSSPSRKSFLVLINKLSMSSNKRNISLINEFINNIWKSILDKPELIKNYKEDILDSYKSQLSDLIDKTKLSDDLKNKYIKDLESINDQNKISAFINWLKKEKEKFSDVFKIKIDSINNDMNNILNNTWILIWYDLHKWIRWEKKKSALVDNEILYSAIRKTAKCDDIDKDIIKTLWEEQWCYYEFRRRYETIPEFAYMIWVSWEWKTEAFKLFLQKLPPLINVEKFSFKKNTSSEALELWQYFGEISLKIFWKSVTNDELSEISKKIWSMCSLNDKKSNISLQIALDNVNKEISKKSNDKENSDSKIFRDLIEIQTDLEESLKTYDKLPNYNKAIKLFEIYRVLADNSIWWCIK